MIMLPSGKILSAHRFAQIARAFPGIFQWQVIQETSRHFIVKLVIDGQPAEGMVSRIRSQFLEYVGEPVDVDIQVVDSMEDDSRKFRVFISKVPSLP